MKKPLLYLVPVYIGSLKYFAKLYPALSKKFDVLFLLVRGNDRRRGQMVEYCKTQGYPFVILEEGLNRDGKSIPFFSPLMRRLRHIRACRAFMQAHKPVKVVLTKTIAPHDAIAREAARAGAELTVLQWSFHSHDPVFVADLNLSKPLYKRLYFGPVRALLALLDVIYVGPRYFRHYLLPAKIGAFDEKAAEGYAVSYRFKRENIFVVGMADFQTVHELRDRISADPAFKQRLLSKYSIDSKKKNILIIAQSFHLRSWTRMTFPNQLAYYRDLIERIRAVVPKEEADILLKLHPGDSPGQYESYRPDGVSVFADESATEELVVLADLIISDTWTTANYLVVASGTPALFVNFTPFQVRNAAIDYYHVKEAVTNKARFDDLLRAWREEKLPPQYDGSFVRPAAIDEAVKLIER